MVPPQVPSGVLMPVGVLMSVGVGAAVMVLVMVVLKEGHVVVEGV